MKRHYCNKCGLRYRKWISDNQFEVCDECDPEVFKKLHKRNITRMKRRTQGQEHITENTWFPKQ